MLNKKEKKVRRIVLDTINDDGAVARGCDEEVVAGNTNGIGFSSRTTGSSTSAGFLALVERFFVFRLRVGGESGRIRGRKSPVIARR